MTHESPSPTGNASPGKAFGGRDRHSHSHGRRPLADCPEDLNALATNVPVETPLWSKQYAGPSPTTLAAQRRDRLLHACLTLDHVPAWVPSRLDSLGDRQLIHAGYTARGWMLVPTFRVTRPASFPWRPNSRPGVESFVAACLAQRTLRESTSAPPAGRARSAERRSPARP